MESTITAVAIVIALGIWHMHNRRHPGWRASDEGRFYICIGYPLIVIACYWLVAAPTATAWEWALGNLWALAAMVAFLCGFDALNTATARHAQIAQQLETVDPAVGAVPRQL